jgi:hypothetical protein
MAGKPLIAAIDAFKINRSAVVHKREPFLHGEKESLHIGVEVKIKELLFHGTEWRQPGNAGICEDDIDLPIAFFDCFIQTIKLAQIGNVALYSGCVSADLCDCRVQHVLAAARDEHTIHAFLNEALCSS